MEPCYRELCVTHIYCIDETLVLIKDRKKNDFFGGLSHVMLKGTQWWLLVIWASNSILWPKGLVLIGPIESYLVVFGAIRRTPFSALMIMWCQVSDLCCLHTEGYILSSIFNPWIGFLKCPQNNLGLVIEWQYNWEPVKNEFEFHAVKWDVCQAEKKSAPKIALLNKQVENL